MVIRMTACALALLAAGCTNLDIPRANNYPASDQKKARAVHHWDVLAEDVAEQVQNTLNTLGVSKQIYVEPAKESSGFNQAFANLLITELVRKGLSVSTKPQGLTSLRFDTQVVRHRTPMDGLNVGDFKITQLNAGVVAAYAIGQEPILALPLGALGDFALMQRHGNAAGGPTKTEVLINTSLVHGERYLARNSTIYYVEDDASRLYATDKGMGKTWGVSGQ